MTPKPHPEVATWAESLGDNKLMMRSYQSFQDGTWTWFFSPNESLDGARRRPGLKGWDDFLALQKKDSSTARVIVDLAELREDQLSASSWKKLAEGYAKWPSNRHAVFQAVSEDKGGYLCNVFVGDTLAVAGKRRMRQGKYYAARQYYKVTVPDVVEVSRDEVTRGDIASWDNQNGTYHLEIVTRVKRYKYLLADDFSSRGAGRGSGQGAERSDDAFSNVREINNKQVKFLRLVK